MKQILGCVAAAATARYWNWSFFTPFPSAHHLSVLWGRSM